jgi:hypothetical protein
MALLFTDPVPPLLFFARFMAAAILAPLVFFIVHAPRTDFLDRFARPGRLKAEPRHVQQKDEYYPEYSAYCSYSHRQYRYRDAHMEKQVHHEEQHYAYDRVDYDKQRVGNEFYEQENQEQCDKNRPNLEIYHHITISLSRRCRQC